MGRPAADDGPVTRSDARRRYLPGLIRRPEMGPAAA
jgi:hypothetical protein